VYDQVRLTLPAPNPNYQANKQENVTVIMEKDKINPSQLRNDQ
jgi:hypothetical protein